MVEVDENGSIAFDKKELQLDNVQRIRNQGGTQNWSDIPHYAEIKTKINLKLSRVPTEQGFYIYVDEDQVGRRIFDRATFYYKYKDSNIEVDLSQKEAHFLCDSYRSFLIEHYIILPEEFDENTPMREV